VINHRSTSTILIFTLLWLLFTSHSAHASFFDKFGSPQDQQNGQELLRMEEAFQLVDIIQQGNELVVQWQSAEGYYFYRDKFRVESLEPSVSIGKIILPQGVVENDPLFGEVQVYFDPIEMRVPIFSALENQSFTGKVEFIFHAQGCNKPVGVCYPPQKINIGQEITELTSFSAQAPPDTVDANVDEEISISNADKQTESNSLLWNILIAFGVGVLLVFTPCVLPMIPIISGVVVGQEQISKLKAFYLTLAYILGTAITYTAMGVAAGAAGIHIQAYFQHPAIIAFMVVLIVVLACSMFGLYELRMPSKFQNHVANKTNSVSTGGFAMTIILGVLSALVVSTCVSPLLILVLGAAMKAGSPFIGGLMMFFMAIGMGVPLMIFALGAQRILPKVGSWMENVKQFFGFALLATAILIASSVKAIPSLILWSVLFVVFSIWLWKSVSGSKGGWAKFFKLISFAFLLWGGANGLGAFYGGDQLFHPLERVINANKPQIQLPFQMITSAKEMEQALNEAKRLKKPVLVEYYADWCTYCIVMEKTTYRDESVAQALVSWKLLKVDVTVPNANTQSTRTMFGIIAPPATLFVDEAGIERTELRRYGVIKPKEFISLTKQVVQ